MARNLTKGAAPARLAIWSTAALLPIVTLYLTVGWRQPTRAEAMASDLAWYFVPTFAVLHRALTEGFLPLWNPYQFAGWPFLAAFQTQSTYPPAWAVAWLDPIWAVTLYAALHWSFAFIGTAAFASELRLSTAACLAAAFTYCLSSSIAGSFFGHSAALAVQSWLPWCALAAARLAQAERLLISVAPLAVALAFALLAGAPEHLSYVMFSVGVIALWRGWEHAGPRGALKACLGTALAAAVAGLLAAVQIVPTLELMKHAVRSVGTFDMTYVGRLSLPVRALIDSVLFGSPGPAAVSVLVAPLAALALCAGVTRRRALVPLLLCVLTLDFLRGPGGYVFPVYFKLVPFVSSFRTHLRAGLVFAFFASLIVGMAVHALTARLAGRPQLQRGAVALLVSVLVLDLVRLSVLDRVYVPLTSREMLLGTPELDDALALIFPSERIFVDFGAPDAGLQHKFGQMHGAHHAADYDALVPAKYARFFGVPEGTPWMGRLQFSDREKPVGEGGATIPGVQLSALDAAATRYYLSPGGARGAWLPSHTHGTVLHSGQYTLVERRQARPRAYVVHRLLSVEDDDAALAAMRAPSFDPASTAVLSTGSVELEVALEAAPANAVETTAITRDEPNRVIVNATCQAKCLLVLTDLYFPGWKASVDGADAPILEANYMFRAVALEAGRHEVEFRYRPASVGIGAGISLVAGLLLLLVHRRARRPLPRALP